MLSSNNTVNSVAKKAAAAAAGFRMSCIDSGISLEKGSVISAKIITGGALKPILLLALAVVCYYIAFRLINQVRYWRRHYLMLEALPTPTPKSLWFYHLKDVMICPNIKQKQINNDGISAKKRPIKNIWSMFLDATCKEMCYEKGHGAFRISMMSPSRLPFISVSSILVIDHKLAKQVVNHPDLQSKGATYDVAKPLTGHSILIASGQDWKRMRKLTQKAFSNKMLKNVHDTSTRILHDKVFPYFDQKQRSKNPYVDIVELLGRFTVDILGISSFSYDFGGVDGLVSSGISPKIRHLDNGDEEGSVPLKKEKDRSIHQMFSEIISDITIANRYRPFGYTPPRMENNVRDFDDIISRVIDARMRQNSIDGNMEEKSKNNNDLLDYLLERNPDGTPILNREEVLGNIKVFSFAGHDTTTSTLSAMFYELSRYPEIIEKLREEIDPFFDEARSPTYNDLRVKCKYVNKVVREVLRLHPPVLFSRSSMTKDVVLQTSKRQYVVPKTTQIICAPWLSQRYYRKTINNTKEEGGQQRCDRPYNEFDPDRTVDFENDPFFPFSMGSKNCVGREMAMTELRAVLVQVVYHYNFSLRPEDKEDGIETYMLLTLCLENFGMEFVKRKKGDTNFKARQYQTNNIKL